MENLYNNLGSIIPDNLIAGNEIDILKKEVTLLRGQGTIKRGTVLGIVTASGLAKPVDSTKTDGTQTPFCILTDDANTGDGTATSDFKTTGYFTGLFNKKALNFGGTDTADKHEATLRELGIFLKDNVAY